MSQQVLISAQDLKKYFPVKGFLGGKTKYLKAVDGVTLDIMKGETFGLVGESGCGKSTLGRTLIRMYDVTGGKLSYQGKDITNAKPSEMKEFRNKMQIIFQDPYSALNPFWNVVPENVRSGYPLYFPSFWSRNGRLNTSLFQNFNVLRSLPIRLPDIICWSNKFHWFW